MLAGSLERAESDLSAELTHWTKNQLTAQVWIELCSTKNHPFVQNNNNNSDFNNREYISGFVQRFEQDY